MLLVVGSGLFAATAALSVIAPATLARTTTVTVAELPTPQSPKEQLTVPVQLPVVVLAETRATPAGSPSPHVNRAATGACQKSPKRRLLWAGVRVNL